MNIAKEFMIQQYTSYMDKISKEEDFWKSYIVEDHEGLVCWIVLDKLNSFKDNERYLNLRSESDSEYSPINIIIFGADEIRPLNDELQYCDEVYASNIKENGMVYKYRKDSGRKIIKVDNSKPKESKAVSQFKNNCREEKIRISNDANNILKEINLCVPSPVNNPTIMASINNSLNSILIENINKEINKNIVKTNRTSIK